MREIKFRAWNKKSKCWSNRFCWSLGLPFKISPSNDEVLQQFTGLRDKNGVEIYEGDICKNGDYEDSAHGYNYRTETVVWDSENASWLGWNFCEDDMICEVIGNIYEHPELLEESSK